MNTAVVASCVMVCLLLLALFAFQEDPKAMRRRAQKLRNAVRKHTGKHRIAIVIPYMGKEIPPYLSLFCTAARGSAALVDFLLIHDGSLRDYNEEPPENVRLIDLKSTLAMAQYMARVVDHRPEFAAKQSSKAYGILERQLAGYLQSNPYLLIEFKPAYGYIFSDFLKGYSHWGYADLDMVFGDLPRWVTKDELTDFDIVTYGFGDQDIVYLRGQFTFHRNEEKINTLWRGCTYLSQIDERFSKAISGEKQLIRESAEGCYSTVVLDRTDIRIKYAVKAFTDVDKQDSVYTHGLYFGIGSRRDRSVVYKAHSSLDGYGLLQVSPTWFEEPHSFYSDPSKPRLQREVGERQLISLEENSEDVSCMYWVRKKYQSKLCLPKDYQVSKSDTIFYIDGKLYKQRHEWTPLPHGIVSAPFFHFQEWKRHYREGQLRSADRMETALTWILTKEGVLPAHAATETHVSVSPLGIKPSRWKQGKRLRKLLPTTRYCLVAGQRLFPPLPKDASACHQSVSWQDPSSVVEILQSAPLWKTTVRELEDVTMVLTLQLSEHQATSSKSTKTLLDLAIANIHSWQAGRQPCILLIYMSGATPEAVATVKDELAYLGNDLCFIALIKGRGSLTEKQESTKKDEEVDDEEVYLDYVSRKALLNMATDIAPTRWILTGVEVERGMVLSIDAALFCYRHAKAHGGINMGTVLVVPQFALEDKEGEDKLLSPFVSIAQLMDMRDKGIVVDPSVVELDDCQTETTVSAVFRPLHKLWWQQTMAELEASQQEERDDSAALHHAVDESAKTISSLETSFTSLMQREHHKTLQTYDNFPILLVDNLSPKAGVTTSHLVREVEELGGKRCYNLLRLSQLATLGYHLQVVSGAFAISTATSRREAMLTMSENDVTRCDGCVMYSEDDQDIERNILRDERYRPAKTAVVWYELESEQMGSSEVLRRFI